MKLTDFHENSSAFLSTYFADKCVKMGLKRETKIKDKDCENKQTNKSLRLGKLDKKSNKVHEKTSSVMICCLGIGSQYDYIYRSCMHEFGIKTNDTHNRLKKNEKRNIMFPSRYFPKGLFNVCHRKASSRGYDSQKHANFETWRQRKCDFIYAENDALKLMFSLRT